MAGEIANVHASLLCQGSIVSGGHVEQSIIGTQAYVDHDAHINESILFPHVRVEPGARLRRCIVDKNVVIPAGMRVGFDLEFDRQHFTISERGVVVIEKDQDLSRLQ